MKILILALSLAGNMALAGQVIGNGGIGITTDLGVVTVSEAGVKLIKPLTKIPGLQVLENEFAKMQLSNAQTSLVTKIFLPNSERLFFSINSQDLDPKELLAIRSQYAQVLKVDVNKVVLFALTDIVTKETYLTESFFLLTENEQAAILFHEGLWLTNSIKNLQHILFLEDLFSQSLKSQDDRARFQLLIELSSLLAEPKLPLSFSLQKTVGKDLFQVFPREFFACFKGLLITEHCSLIWEKFANQNKNEDLFLLNLIRHLGMNSLSLIVDVLDAGNPDFALLSGKTCQLSQVSDLGYGYEVQAQCLDGYQLRMSISPEPRAY